MQTVKPKPGDAAWKFTEEAGGSTPRQCDFWAWKEAPANDAWTKGCWVAAADYVPGQINPPCPGCGKGNGADGTWIGASKCLDPVRSIPLHTCTVRARQTTSRPEGSCNAVIFGAYPAAKTRSCPAAHTLTCGTMWGCRSCAGWFVMGQDLSAVLGSRYGHLYRWRHCLRVQSAWQWRWTNPWPALRSPTRRSLARGCRADSRRPGLCSWWWEEQRWYGAPAQTESTFAWRG
eukprot:COSAG02_NODE_8438_length_2570_cov_1.562930_3_plen_232_part_00